MADKDFTLGSGAVVHVTTASFDDCNALTKAISRCAKGLPITDDVLGMNVGVLKDYLVAAIGSDDVERTLFKCMERATYAKEGAGLARINKALFDDPQLGDAARQDYFEICAKIIEVDVAPFFVQAFSVLKARMASAASSQKSA